MSNIYYLNSRNERVDFIEDFPLLSIDDMFKSTYTNEVKNNLIQKFKQEITNFTITGDEPVINYDDIADIFDYDVLKNARGRFYIGEYYMLCNITVVSPSDVNLHRKKLKTTLTVTTSSPYWIKETSHVLDQSIIQESSNLKQYTYSYPYVYSKQRGAVRITNDSFIESDAVIRMFGPCTNPFIKIGDVLYQVNVTLENGEYLEIDTQKGTIYKYTSYGDKTTVFHYRDKSRSDFFAKIPSGTLNVTWSAQFRAEIIVLEKRSKPRWIG